MKIATELISHVIVIDDEHVSSVIIEDGTLFRKFVSGLYSCVEQGDDCFAFSEAGETIKAEDSIEIVNTFVPFSLNTKALLGGLAKKLEKRALSSDLRDQTEQVIEAAKKYVWQLTLDMPMEVSCDGLTIGSLVKACSLSFADDDLGLADRLIGYFRLFRELVGDRVFALVNARTYFRDDELNGLLDLCLAEHVRILLIDAIERQKFAYERRLLIDRDLCELTSEDDNMV